MVTAPKPGLKLRTALPLPPLGSSPGPPQSQLTESIADRTGTRPRSEAWRGRQSARAEAMLEAQAP